MKLLIAAIAMIMATSASPALMQAYSVEPVKASWSGWIAPEIGISQTITCNFDSIVYCELFVGELNAEGAGLPPGRA